SFLFGFRRRPHRASLFPYTTLFRSGFAAGGAGDFVPVAGAPSSEGGVLTTTVILKPLACSPYSGEACTDVRLGFSNHSDRSNWRIRLETRLLDSATPSI